ncbi:hypothetical protein IEO21_03999 [Rhodonia placenta]|uniref:Uncharacterized protein n=1 Tax=Rhodonia placenta TaxID=104341 RepID=A0A8H7P4M7_9APHY|nr:hypothetical protein IEO21_03999 [Postia placenta]
MTLTINTDMLIERPPSRAHPPSPVGPRPQKPRPVSAFVTTPRPSQDPPQFFSPNLQARPMFPTLQRVQTDSAASPGQGHSQSAFAQLQARELPPPPVRRGSAPPPIGWAGLSPGVPRSNYRASMAAPSPVIHAPMPVQAPATPMLPMITAPKVPDVKLQQTFDQYADMVNLQAASWNASHVDRPTGSAREPLDDRMDITEDRVASGTGRAGPCEAMDTASRTSVMNDKENCAVNGTSPKAHRHDNAHNAGGLGFGHSVPMAKEMGNLVFFNEPAHKDQHKDKKDRRSRPPALDLYGTPLLQKRATFSMIGSPSPMSPPASLIGSPVVGEFKGWFSNLFHWKVQSYLLYSVSDIHTTRNETLRLLDLFGIVWVLEENHGWHVIKCRTDDTQDGPAALHKQVRFRIEVSPTAGSQGYSQPGTTPRLSQNNMSPQASSASRFKVERMNGHESVIGLVLEKGAVSTFKVIYHRLRSEWRLDTLQSPLVAMMGGGTPSIEQRFMS